MKTLSLLFGFNEEVTRTRYWIAGLSLMLLKYLVELVTLLSLDTPGYTPLDFINPFLSGRERFVESAPAWLGMAWAIWTMPFLWIAVSMSLRRADQAGISPWWSLMVLVPIINWLAMIVLGLLPPRKSGRMQNIPSVVSDDHPKTIEAESIQIRSAWEPPVSPSTLPPSSSSSSVKASLLGIAAGGGFMMLTVMFSVYIASSYGIALFGTPLITGAVSSFFLNSPRPTTLGWSIGHALLTVLLGGLSLLVFAIEGIICIAMAFPIMMPMVMLGAWIGYAIAHRAAASQQSHWQGLYGCLLTLPCLMLIETKFTPEPTLVVTTSVDIDANPETVWNHVVAFHEITTPPAWYFRAGIACPRRARIVGEGVGAIRYCEFTTGVLVEPITVWKPSEHLAFDVRERPEPMFELTPYRHIHPPHLDGSMRSVRGEFRFDPLPEGRTRLTGRTWYQLDIKPIAYWSVWSDGIIHRIHQRVLEHIRTSATEASNVIAKTQ